jgi:hypothetical protein
MISSRRFLPGRSCLLTLCVRSSRNMGRRQLTTLLTRRRLMRRRAKPIAWTIPSILSSSGKRWRITAVKRPGRSLSIRPTSSFIWSRAKAARCVMALASAGLGFCGRGSRPSRQSANGPIGPRRRKCSHAAPTCRDSCRAASIIHSARALYLGSSLYRIDGSNEPWTIGTNVSSGCVRMRNEDVTDLYGRVKIGTKVIVIGSQG